MDIHGGTVVGTDIINEYSDKIAGYIGIGQIVNVKRQEEISYNYTLAKAKEVKCKKDLVKLEKMGSPINGLYKDRVKDLYTERKLLLKYGGSLYGKSNYSDVIKILLKYKDYNLFDLVRYFNGNTLSLENIWDSDFANIDLIHQLPKVGVPIFFFVGKNDYQTPFELVESYFNTVNAPEKRLIWFEHSAHSPIYEEVDKFTEEVNNCFK